ncbi:MAG TPA: amidase family protein [Vicinamibacterales bacterium]|nr:amidase family protein [Vicinamibacterales bacterium]
MRKSVLIVAGLLAGGAPFAAQSVDRHGTAPSGFSVFEASIADMQAAMKSGRTTSHAIVQQYLTRIATYEDKLHAAITVNPRALDEADQRDRERAQGRLRGPLHGIPIALKDNIHTTDMPTTGGALAFDGLMPPYEATLTKNLREAGAIIIAKTGMTELANYVAANMPTNYNAIQGYGFNPYDPRRDPRADGRPVLQTGGSSSGIGTAANFWAGNVGTETSGSILSPSNQNMLAAVKPTVGLISRYGVIPITADQDTPGPMAKYVSDIAVMLGVLQGKADANDSATTRCTPPPGNDYTRFLKADGLKGARIGIPRKNYYEPFDAPVVRPEGAAGGAGGGGGGGGRGGGRGGLNPAQTKVMEEAIAALKAAGAAVIDVDIPSMLEKDPKENLLTAGQSVVLNYGMKRDFNTWLQSLGPAAPVKSLTELRDWNTAHEALGAIKYGQSQLDASDRIDLEKDKAKYEEDRARDIRVYGTNGIDAAIKANNLDALVFPGPASAGIASKPGYPTVLVPFGMIPNPAPFFGGRGRGGRGGDAAAGRGDAAAGRGNAPVAGRGATPPTETAPTGTPAAAAPPAPTLPPGFDPKPQPFGVGFTAGACSEPKLLQLAYGFEQATKKRTPPPGLR